MRCELALLLSTFLAGAAAAQQPASSSPAPAGGPQPALSIAYYASPGVTAPEVLPPSAPIAPIKHCKKVNGKAVISAVVDANGVARETYFLHPIGSILDLDQFALDWVAADQFKPGTRNGTPAAVVTAIRVDLALCIVKTKDAAGNTAHALKLRSQPVQQISLQNAPPGKATLTFWDGGSPGGGNLVPITPHKGDGITPPVPILTPPPHLITSSRPNPVDGTCVISLIVDVHGMPQDLRVTRSLDPYRDQAALLAVSQYRFKPAMKNGQPVPVKIKVAMKIRIF